MFANFLHRTDGKHKMVCTSFQNYHNFPNKKVTLHIQPDMLFPSIKPNNISLMFISIFLFLGAPSLKYQGNEIMLKRSIVRKREENKVKKWKRKRKQKAHLLSAPSTFWTQREAPGAGRGVWRGTSIVFCNRTEGTMSVMAYSPVRK